MASLSHEAPAPTSDRPRRAVEFVVREVWGSIAICVIWLTVLFDALFGPDITTRSGLDGATVPSAVVLVVFAWLATVSIAKYAFGRTRGEE